MTTDLENGLPCVHCGLCLDTCPTYRVLGTEADSPRGRLYIMKAIHDGTVDLDADARRHLDGCLGCLACETACPSGVSYGRHIDAFRPLLHEAGPRRSVLGRIAERVQTGERAFSAALAAATVLDRVGLSRVRRRIPAFGLLPGKAATSGRQALDPIGRSHVHQPVHPRARVALLTGCIGDRALPGINRDAVEVLQRNGIEVVNVAEQGCCGALPQHEGRHDEARRLARVNVDAFAACFDRGKEQGPIDYVVTTASGCGSMMREYAHVLGEDRERRESADLVARKTRDICELLCEIGFEKPTVPDHLRERVAYHDACHLAHACKVIDAPREVCEAATGIAPVDLGENSICCGSAGSYNLRHPELADLLGMRKAELAAERRATTVAVGNSGCMLQIARALALAKVKAVVRHPIELLAETYRQIEHESLTRK